MTYYERPDRLEIYKNSRAAYPTWPAQHALTFANNCMAYRLLFPKATRPCGVVKCHPAIGRHGTHNSSMMAPRATSNPWNPVYKSEANPGKWRWVENDARNDNGIRLAWKSETSWYSDHCQCETVTAIVVQLPARNGRIPLLSGFCYADEPSEGMCLRVDDVEYGLADTDEEVGGIGYDQAKRAAEGYAESTAQFDREESERYEAERRIDEKKDDILELFKSRHDNGVNWARQAIQTIRNDIRTLVEEPWSVTY